MTKCEGCRSYEDDSGCGRNLQTDISDLCLCPCIICLVKGVCVTPCDDYWKYYWTII